MLKRDGSVAENSRSTTTIETVNVVTTSAVEQSRGLTKVARNPVDLARLTEPELPFDEAV